MTARETSRSRDVLPYLVGALLAVLVVLGLGLLLGRGAGGEGQGAGGASSAPPVTSTPPDRRPGTAGPAPAGLQAVLDRRAAAARAGDEAAWLADVAPGPFREHQRQVLGALRGMPLTTFTYRVVGPAPTPGHAPAAAGASSDEVVDVVGEWALRDVDQRPARYALRLQVRRDAAGRWVLVGEAPGTVRQVFDLPGARTLETPAGLVVGNAPRARLEEYAQALAQARPRVETAWGPATGRPVVVVPSTTEDFAALTGRDAASSREVAAVTTGLLTPGETSRGDKVVINPASWSRLDGRGREVVLTHELTHLLVRTSTTHGVPEWLGEGYAVAVSYAHLDVDPRAAAPALVAQARSGRVPAALPGDDAFGVAVSGSAYDEAWLAVRHLVRAHGQQAVTRFYRELATGMPPQRAWQHLGTTEESLVAGWQEDLRALAR